MRTYYLLFIVSQFISTNLFVCVWVCVCVGDICFIYELKKTMQLE